MKIELNVEEFIESLRKFQGRKQKEMDKLKRFPHHQIVYESDLKQESDHQVTLDKVFEFLGLDPIMLSLPKYIKTFSKPYSEIVSNYAEIKNAAIEAGLIKP